MIEGKLTEIQKISDLNGSKGRLGGGGISFKVQFGEHPLLGNVRWCGGAGGVKDGSSTSKFPSFCNSGSCNDKFNRRIQIFVYFQ